MSVRLIPRLDIKAPNLVKGVHLEGLRVLGDPARFARFYYQQGADELLYMDIVASLYQRNTILELVQATSQEIFIPLTVGGGLRSLEDMRRALGRGADKVALNTAALARPELIREAAREFGSSAVVVSIEAKRRPQGGYEAYCDCGRERSRREVVEWARQACDLGAGEILLTSIDQEGTGGGYDLELTRLVSRAVPVPVIACGGAGRPGDLVRVVKEGQADAVCLASLLHYSALEQEPGLAGQAGTGPRRFSRVARAGLGRLKARLGQEGIPCRP